MHRNVNKTSPKTRDWHEIRFYKWDKERYLFQNEKRKEKKLYSSKFYEIFKTSVNPCTNKISILKLYIWLFFFVHKVIR